MEVGIKKSGYIWVHRRNNKTNEDIEGIPNVDEYKYLGMMVNGQLDIKAHIQYINKKIMFITNRLTALRYADNLKLNINLFRIFILPLYRLSLS